jgi:hypothetical protein
MMTLVGAFSFYSLTFIVLTYLFYQLLVGFFFKTKDLKRAYGAKWALVTGSSSGKLIPVA